MGEITYIESLVTANSEGHKLAKINQAKMLSLKGKYNAFLKTVEKPQVEIPTPLPKEEVKVEEKVIPVTPVTPLVSIQTPLKEEVKAPVVECNYAEVVDKFSMTVYDKSFEEISLVNARKIRVNPKVSKHVLGLGNKFGLTKLENVVLESSVESIVDDVSVEPELKVETPVQTVSKPVDTVLESSVKDTSIPSVDDYLQKEVPNPESGLIIQLNDDVEKLKEETVKRADLLEQMEAKYNELRAQKARRIKELEEEKLSYTATLDGLTERIKNLQAAIEKEEQSLAGYKKAA